MNSLKSFIAAVERAKMGQLPTDLVSPEELDTTLARVRSLAGKKGLLLVHNDLDFYYTHTMTAFMYTKDHLYIHLRVPVSRQVAWYDLYHVHTFGIPSQSKDFQAYTKIKSEVSLLAVSRDGNYFIEITKADRKNCKGKELVRCTVVPNRLPTNQPSCMYAIFSNHLKGAEAKCKHTAFPNREVPTYIRKLEGSDVIVTAGSHPITVACSGPQVLECQVCLVHIPCGCTLTTQDFVVYPDDTDCQTGLEVEAKQGVNMAMAYAFNLTVPDGSLVSVTTNTSYRFLLPSLRHLYGNDSLTLDAGVPLEELAADISARMRKLKEKANRGVLSNFYTAAVTIMDPVVWIWFAVLSMAVVIS